MNSSYLNLFFLQIPQPQRVSHQRIVGSTFSIGRKSPASANEQNFISIPNDKFLGTVHARCYRENGIWLVQDLGTKNGTFIDRERLPTDSPAELRTGSVVQMGKTTWTICTQAELLVRWDDVIVWGKYTGFLSPILPHTRTPILSNVYARNLRANQSTAFEISLELDPSESLGKLKVPSLDSLEKHPIPDHLNLESNNIISPSNRHRRVDMRLIAHGVKLRAPQTKIDVIGLHDFVLQSDLMHLAAAHIRPTALNVIQALSEIEKSSNVALSNKQPHPSIPHGGNEAKIKTLYSGIKKIVDFHYCLPSAKRLENKGVLFQSLVPIEDLVVLNDADRQRIVSATCFDLSLLILSLGEAIDLCPILVLTGSNQGIPDHAMAAFWEGQLPGFQAKLNKNRLLEAIQANQLKAVEATGIATVSSRNPPKLEFEEARCAAENKIRTSVWAVALDIRRLREPPYSVLPL